MFWEFKHSQENNFPIADSQDSYPMLLPLQIVKKGRILVVRGGGENVVYLKHNAGFLKGILNHIELISLKAELNLFSTGIHNQPRAAIGKGHAEAVNVKLPKDIAGSWKPSQLKLSSRFCT